MAPSDEERGESWSEDEFEGIEEWDGDEADSDEDEYFLTAFHELMPEGTFEDYRWLQVEENAADEEPSGDSDSPSDAPFARFVMVELYCPKPGCDCREMAIDLVRVSEDNEGRQVASRRVDLDAPLASAEEWEQAEEVDDIDLQAIDFINGDDTIFTDDHFESHYRLVKQFLEQE